MVISSCLYVFHLVVCIITMCISYQNNQPIIGEADGQKRQRTSKMRRTTIKCGTSACFVFIIDSFSCNSVYICFVAIPAMYMVYKLKEQKPTTGTADKLDVQNMNEAVAEIMHDVGVIRMLAPTTAYISCLVLFIDIMFMTCDVSKKWYKLRYFGLFSALVRDHMFTRMYDCAQSDTCEWHWFLRQLGLIDIAVFGALFILNTRRNRTTPRT